MKGKLASGHRVQVLVLLAGWAGVFVPEMSAAPGVRNVDVRGGFVFNHGFINAGDLGLSFTNAGIRDVSVSAGQFCGVDPETGATITNAANLLPLQVRSLQAVGDIAAGGVFIGDGSGLTMLCATNLIGILSTNQLPPELFFASGGDGGSVAWGAIRGTLSAQADLWSLMAEKVGRGELEPIAVDAAFSNLTVGEGEIGQSLVSGLTNDLERLRSALQICAEGVESLDAGVNTLSSDLTGHDARIAMLELRSDLAGATNAVPGSLTVRSGLVVQGALVAVYVPPQGGLPMGSFTNGLPQ